MTINGISSYSSALYGTSGSAAASGFSQLAASSKNAGNSNDGDNQVRKAPRPGGGMEEAQAEYILPLHVTWRQ